MSALKEKLQAKLSATREQVKAILRDYPEADVIPEVLFVLHDSYSQIGFQREADAVREHLLQTYPESSEATKLPQAGEPGGS